MKHLLLRLLPVLALSTTLLTGCAGHPIAAEPVTGFDADRYLGTWYEVARLDHRFERGLSNVSATYTRREDGKITVQNRGFKDKSATYKTATGKAKFADSSDVGHLKVSFFGPFYGDYIIFDLDTAAYSRAYVSGGKDNYLWLLSRTPTVSDSVRQDFIAKSEALGYDMDGIIWVDQSK